MSTTGDILPILDLRDLDAGPERARALAGRMGEAARRHGTFWVVGHGVPDEARTGALEAARAFFALPAGEKARIRADGGPRGYQPLPDGAGDWKEMAFFTTALDGDPPPPGSPVPGANPWPERPEGFRQAVEACADQLVAVGRRVMAALALDLGVSPEVFLGALAEPGGGALRLLRYPPAREGGAARARHGVHAHTDISPVTIIAQNDVAGVEFRDADGRWAPVEPVEGGLLCQTGDMLSVWTNDQYVANLHRVVNATDRERLSACLFLLPAYGAAIEPLPSCVGSERPARYPTRTFGEHLAAWQAKMAVEEAPHRHPGRAESV